MTCKIGPCPRASKHRGYCEMHYRRLMRTGSPHGASRDPATSSSNGLGVIACAICDRPVRDHRIGRCPEWEKAL